jgi:IS1 family transposase
VLGISTNKVIDTLKKKELIQKVNPHYINTNEYGETIDVDIVCYNSICGIELDEQWSYVGNKGNQRWLWLALDHQTSDIIAFTFGKRSDAVFLELREMIKDIGIGKYFSDDWGAYTRNLCACDLTIGKEYTQAIERENLNFRTRIKRLTRKTICFSKSEIMHDTVIGLYINECKWGLKLE